jgi:hypothetical protein
MSLHHFKLMEKIEAETGDMSIWYVKLGVYFSDILFEVSSTISVRKFEGKMKIKERKV